MSHSNPTISEFQTLLKNEIKPLSDRLGAVEHKIESLEKGQQSILKQVKKLRSDLKVTISTFDGDIVYHAKRLDRLDRHLNLPHLPRPL